MTQPPRRPATLLFILIVVLIDVMGIGLVVPVLPGLVKELSGSEAAGARMIGILTAAYAVMQFLMAPILGRLSDRFGRRPVLLVATAGMALDYLVLYFAPSVWWLLLGRMVAGATGASLTVINAYIADVSPPEERAANFGKVGAMFGVGFILGPALGGLLGDYGLRVPFLFAAGISALSWLYGLLILPESLPPGKRTPGWNWAEVNPLKPLAALTAYPAVRNLTGVFILVGLAMQVIFTTWVLYTEAVLGWTAGQNGVALAVSGLLSALVSAFLVGRAVSAWGEKKTLLVGLGFGVAEFLILSVANTTPLLYFSLVVGAITGLAQPAIQGYVSSQVADSEQGRVQGAITSLQSVVGIVGPLLATSVFAAFTAEHAPLGLHFPGAAFLMAAALMVAGIGLTLRAFRRNERLAGKG
ncbi:major facilitator superfamily MFS_1 [Deinococcus proteolyticus MRP]|uniref:Major facilitator superfamily MFS_1 n=1 Tax=Deinococcus proteolyticus (strain ATCC 35074 / DSM 20540 / JCM 6276 / NBRC 101906 / NCIMB 13154 / VKM Ac-1939 / CCM 2703 / MRP) TaxID=693977 RepID=F0RME1_DEIPM|nr:MULTISPECIES: tetracycline resistance MFS efflux pump [Deinococcus]ADY27078.1 major facilitator superfamily MFS_1 [Deinococcus proteolyticus MRP]MCY1703202.1 tetracycline resistance MFS efflux pump [Deinococcus sp. SL84]